MLQHLGAPVRHRDRKHSGPAGLLGHRDPDANPIVSVGHDWLAEGERPACHRPRDDLAVSAGGERKQHVAGEVPEVHHRVPRRYRRAGGGEHVPEIAAGHLPQDAEGVWVAGNMHCRSPCSGPHPTTSALSPPELSEMSAPKPRPPPRSASHRLPLACTSMSYDMVVQAFAGGGAAPMPSAGQPRSVSICPKASPATPSSSAPVTTSSEPWRLSDRRLPFGLVDGRSWKLFSARKIRVVYRPKSFVITVR